MATAPILFMNSWSTAHGGSSTSLIDIVCALDRSKFAPMVVCPAPGDLPQRLAEADVPVIIHRLSRLKLSELPRFLAEVPWYVRLLRSKNVQLVHGNTSPARRSLVQAAALCGLPYVQHVRNSATSPRRYFGYRVAAQIVTNSNAVATELKADPMFAHKTRTIYNAVDLSLYRGTDDRRKELGCGARLVIGFVGQLVPRKGLRTVIAAMPQILVSAPDALLVIVGCAPPDEPDYERACRALVDELGIAHCVRFVGYRRDVPAWMRTFDVFALPTRAEPFGKVVIEAMAAERPVVVTSVGGIPEIVTSAELGTLVPPDDVEATAREVLRYLLDPPLRARTGTIAAEAVRRRFSLERMMDQLQSLYDELLLGTGTR